MTAEGDGYFSARVEGLGVGDRYFYLLEDNKERPDPVSRYLPEGVHGPTQIVSADAFDWTDARWKGVALEDLIIYELHTGTFSPSGDFKGITQKLPYLKNLGVNCIELMPVNQFPGKYNWGYDGVNLYAIQNTYGNPQQLKQLVDACHHQGIAVCMDVVYNHFGPEGNYLHDFGPYFTGKYNTPWGDAFNYDDVGSDAVRRYVIDNVRYWVEEYHVDVLRLDAIHGIFDFGARHILRELKEAGSRLAAFHGRELIVIAESDLNDPRVVNSTKQGGYALDAQWSDDFHHSLHVALTREQRGYYSDYNGLDDLAKALKETFVYDGRYSASRQRQHGESARKLDGKRFVISIQNHDQVGNRPQGDRLSASISFETEKLAAVLTLLSPYIPMLWMGQEYGEKAPFYYFVDHSDKELVEAVRAGRRREFEGFKWDGIADPKSPSTYEHSKLCWDLYKKGKYAMLFSLYKKLVSLRKKMGIVKKVNKKNLRVRYSKAERWLSLEYKYSGAKKVGVLLSFSENVRTIQLPFSGKKFRVELDTNSRTYGGKQLDGERKYSKVIELNQVGALIGGVKA